MPVYNDEDVKETIQVAAFVAVFSLLCIAALVVFSIIRDQQFIKTDEKTSKHIVNVRESTRNERTTTSTRLSTSED